MVTDRGSPARLFARSLKTFFAGMLLGFAAWLGAALFLPAFQPEQEIKRDYHFYLGENDATHDDRNWSYVGSVRIRKGEELHVFLSDMKRYSSTGAARSGEKIHRVTFMEGMGPASLPDRLLYGRRFEYQAVFDFAPSEYDLAKEYDYVGIRSVDLDNDGVGEVRVDWVPRRRGSGHWMPIVVFRNENGRWHPQGFPLKSEAGMGDGLLVTNVGSLGLEDTLFAQYSWHTKLFVGDIDRDGGLDFAEAALTPSAALTPVASARRTIRSDVEWPWDIHIFAWRRGVWQEKRHFRMKAKLTEKAVAAALNAELEGLGLAAMRPVRPGGP